MTTLVLGSNGFLGSYVSRINWEEPCLQATSQIPTVYKHNLKIIRFANRDSLWNFLQEIKPKVIINCIALANLEKCESDIASATWINVEIPRILAEYSNVSRAHLVHFSTDAVLKGNEKFKSESHEEFHRKSQYGITKLLGEKDVLSISNNSLVLRVNFFGQSPSDNSLSNFFINNLKAGKEVSGFIDVFFTPIYAKSLSEILKKLIEERFLGLYHLVGSDRLSKYDFGVKIAKSLSLDETLIVPKSSSMLENSNFSIREFELSLSNNLLKTRGIRFNTIDQDIEYFTDEIRRGRD